MESAKKFIERKVKKDANKIKNNKPIKIVKAKNIERTGHNHWQIDARIFMQQDNHATKVFVIERLSFVKSTVKNNTGKVGKQEYRIGYYIVGHHGNKKGKWTWGQYCPFIPKDDFTKLLKL